MEMFVRELERERERGRVYHKFWPESINLKQKYNNKSLDSKFRLIYTYFMCLMHFKVNIHILAELLCLYSHALHMKHDQEIQHV
jgi:hypothetical protein